MGIIKLNLLPARHAERPGRGYLFLEAAMPPEPQVKRTVSFIDGQNLFHAARESFGYTYPNYDVVALSGNICTRMGWQLVESRFYTGIPDPLDDPFWNHFWMAKLRVMSWQKIHIYSRSLRYRNRRVTLPDGRDYTFLTGEEKGIDVRIALDVIRMAHRVEYDVALIFSQDQDLSEVAEEIRAITLEQNRWIKIACAFPFSPTTINKRGPTG
jgi:uncharacterized LabA/DUF88 family protein